MATTPVQFEIPANEVPLISVPQRFGISINNVGYVLQVAWCWPCECWMMDIYDGATLTPILQGIPFVTGADLLAQFQHLGFGGHMIVQSDYDTLAMPTFTNLGSLSHLFWVPDIVLP